MEARDKLQRLRERAAIRRQGLEGRPCDKEHLREMDELAREVMPYQVLPNPDKEG